MDEELVVAVFVDEDGGLRKYDLDWIVCHVDLLASFCIGKVVLICLCENCIGP